MKIKLYYLISVVLLFSFFACSEVKDDITPLQSEGIHKAGIVNPSSPDFHAKLIAENNWDLSKCQSCHGANYAGGTTGASCLTCHTQSDGPEACNTCHGDFADPTRIAPPADVSGNISPSSRGVGAHTLHAYETTQMVVLGCFECHPSEVPAGKTYVEGHVGPAPADVMLGGRANFNVAVAASYDATTQQCSNTYCHGNFAFGNIVGNNFAPVWNKIDGTQGACGTCHGQVIAGALSPLPVGHFGTYNATQCSLCHPSVVDNQGQIIAPDKHINGEKNLP